jgi:hypothetical protein
VARPGFQKHPKFRRLVHLLKEPVPHVLGYCECLWDVCYENGNDYLGEALDVELAAQWPGEPGKLTRALAAVGLIDVVTDVTDLRDFRDKGEKDARPLIPDAIEPIRYRVHDLFDHAPDYVFSRAQREEERKKTKICEWCGSPYRSKDKRSKYCSDNCRQSNHRHGLTTDRNGKRAATVSVTQRNGTPAPAPAPAPAPTNPPTKPPSQRSVPAAQTAAADAVPAGGLAGGIVFSQDSEPGPRKPRSAALPESDIDAANRAFDSASRHQSAPAGWAPVADRLAGLGASRWREAISEAKECGCTPQLAMQIIDHGTSKGFQVGAIVCRLSKSRPTLPIDAGWPLMETADVAAKRKAERTAERAARERLDAEATHLIKRLRREKKSDDEIKAALAAAGLEWPT